MFIIILLPLNPEDKTFSGDEGDTFLQTKGENIANF